ncbi:hypothetical protein M885DRAFT_567610 [Pelagophyceae sp. CCMP2097]|nr:hypothetical protein M885DRAFT_567610 [Pelagophyceae sp. CCMP2097]
MAFAWRLAAALGSLLGAARGFGSMSTDEGALPLLSSLAPEVLHALTPPASSGAYCLDESAFSFFVVPRAGATRVVIELASGDSCWDAASCEFAFSRAVGGAPINEVDPKLLALDGATSEEVKKSKINLAFDKAAFAGDTYIYVPYCTMDSHYGSASAEYEIGGVEMTLNHNGWANVQTAIDWAKANFKASTKRRKWSSRAARLAGANVAPLVAASLAPAFGSVSVLTDSFVGLHTDEFVQDSIFGTWAAQCAFASVLPDLDLKNPRLNTADATIEMLRELLRYYPKLSVGAYQTVHDATQMFYLLNSDTGTISSLSEKKDLDTFARLIVSRIENLASEFPSQFSAFVAYGNSHCRADVDLTEAHGLWVEAVLGGFPVPVSQACENCTLAALPGCDGVFGSLLVESHCYTCDEACPDPVTLVDFSVC